MRMRYAFTAAAFMAGTAPAYAIDAAQADRLCASAAAQTTAHAFCADYAATRKPFLTEIRAANDQIVSLQKNLRQEKEACDVVESQMSPAPTFLQTGKLKDCRAAETRLGNDLENKKSLLVDENARLMADTTAEFLKNYRHPPVVAETPSIALASAAVPAQVAPKSKKPPDLVKRTPAPAHPMQPVRFAALPQRPQPTVAERVVSCVTHLLDCLRR